MKCKSRPWASWVYVLGIPAVALVATQIGSTWSHDLIVGIAAAAVYALAAWIFLQFLVRPQVRWVIGLANDQSLELQVVYSTVPSNYLVLLNGNLVSGGQSWRLAVALPERVAFLLGDGADHRAFLTLRTSLWSRMRLSLEVDGRHLVDA